MTTKQNNNTNNNKVAFGIDPNGGLLHFFFFSFVCYTASVWFVLNQTQHTFRGCEAQIYAMKYSQLILNFIILVYL